MSKLIDALYSLITGLTADATPDGAADYVMTVDASGAALKKVLLDNLPGGESGTPASRLVGTVINDTVVGVGGAASWDVASIPTGYIWLDIVLQGKTTDTGVDNGQVVIALNNDTTNANYRRALNYSGTNTGNDVADLRQIGYLGTSNGSYTGGQLRITLHNYDSALPKTLQAFGAERYNDAGSILISNVFLNWENTAAISRITITPIAGNFAQGTRITLIGYKAESILM